MKPLTIEELKALEVGDWVWFLHNQVKPCYGTIMSKHDDTIYFNTTEGLQRVHWKNYGKTWVVYKNKEQAEAKGEIVELPCKAGDIIFVPYVHKGVSDIMRLIVDKVQIEKHSIVFCTDFDTDDEVFSVKFSNGLFSLGTFGHMWFTDKTIAKARLQELRGEK